MKVLVTGAAGFVGSHVLKRLIELGIDARGLDNFSPYYSIEYKRKRLGHFAINQGSQVEKCDIADFTQVQDQVSRFKPNYVIHLAAQAGVRLGLDESETYISSNILGFYNLIRSCIGSNVSGLLYASSSSVYGDSTETPYNENAKSLRPKSAYGVSKLCNELLADVYSQTSNLRFRGLRYFTVYGPWGRPDMAYFRMAAAALGAGEFVLFGDGSVKRDFTYIDDVVANTIALLDDLTRREPGFNDLVNIGGCRPLDMNYLIKEIAKNSDVTPKIKKGSASRLDSRITIADNTYLKSILGDINFTSLEKGIEILMNWAKQNEIRSELGSWVSSTF